MDFKNTEITELIYAVRERNDAAFAELVERYSPMMSKVISGFLSPQLLRDEALSEACVALHRAALSYDVDNRSVTFGLYAQICVYRRVCDAAARAAKEPMILDVDLDRCVCSSGGIESSIEGRERMQLYLKAARSILSDYEYRVFLCYINGDSTDEIARLLGKDRKSIENAKTRMLRHLRKGSDIFSDI